MAKAHAVLAVLVLVAACCCFFPESRTLLQGSYLPRKFATSSGKWTATRSYSLVDSETLKSRYVPCSSNCSWEHYTNNEDFHTNFRRPFDIDDDQRVTAMREQLACVPSPFGFSKEKGEVVFPMVHLPSCDSVEVAEPRPVITFNASGREFTIECPEGSEAKYILQPKQVPETTQYGMFQFNKLWSVERYRGLPVKNVHGEFVYASCGKEFTNAVLIPRFKAEAYDRAKAVINKKTGGRGIRPMHMLFIAVDSFSRRHFYRKMPKTVEFLSNLNAAQNYSVFDFKVHNVLRKHSPENMVPMFTNEPSIYRKTPPEKETTGNFSLWQVAKRLGYVTNLSFESCGSNFINFLGRELTVDHHVSSFFCAARTHIQSAFDESNARRRCIGPHWGHYYLLNYTYEFARIYQGVNQFQYIHLEGAHESSGQFAGTLDEDLSEFLSSYLARFGEHNDLVIMIQGDHGMRYGEWHKTIEASQEMKLPVMYFIAQTELLKRLPFSLDALWHNSFRLVSKRDFRATILSLFTVPFNEEYPVHLESYLSQTYVLHREKIRDSRECKDAHIPPWYCSCLEMTAEVSPFLLYSSGRSHIEKLLLEVIDETLRLINEKIVTTKNLLPGLICQRLTLDRIIRAFGFNLSPHLEQVKVEFSVLESPSARIEAIAIIGTDDKISLFERDEAWYAIDPYIYIGNPTHVRVIATQVISFSRKDKYAGPCEDVSSANEVDAEFCVCVDLEDIRERKPALFPDSN